MNHDSRTEQRGPRRLAVVGSRSFCDYEMLSKVLDSKRNNIRVIVSGGARGADALVARYARQHNIALLELHPDWKTHGRSAGLLRNTDIVAECDEMLAFWDGESRGTKDSIDKAKRAGKTVTIVHTVRSPPPPPPTHASTRVKRTTEGGTLTSIVIRAEKKQKKDT